MAHTPYHIDFTGFSPLTTLSPEEKAQRTKEQKAARQKEIASVTQEDINKAIKDLESGKTPYIYNPGF